MNSISPIYSDQMVRSYGSIGASSHVAKNSLCLARGQMMRCASFLMAAVEENLHFIGCEGWKALSNYCHRHFKRSESSFMHVNLTYKHENNVQVATCKQCPCACLLAAAVSSVPIQLATNITMTAISATIWPLHNRTVHLIWPPVPPTLLYIHIIYMTTRTHNSHARESNAWYMQYTIAAAASCNQCSVFTLHKFPIFANA